MSLSIRQAVSLRALSPQTLFPFGSQISKYHHLGEPCLGVLGLLCQGGGGRVCFSLCFSQASSFFFTQAGLELSLPGVEMAAVRYHTRLLINSLQN